MKADMKLKHKESPRKSPQGNIPFLSFLQKLMGTASS
jgi:hypothetical protein